MPNPEALKITRVKLQVALYLPKIQEIFSDTTVRGFSVEWEDLELYRSPEKPRKFFKEYTDLRKKTKKVIVQDVDLFHNSPPPKMRPLTN